MAGFRDRIRQRVRDFVDRPAPTPSREDLSPPAESPAAPRTDSGREIPQQAWDARGWVTYNPHDPIEVSSADNSGKVHVVQDARYKTLRPGLVTIRDGAVGEVVSVGEDVVFITVPLPEVRVDHPNARTVARLERGPWGVRKEDIVNLKLEEERRWAFSRLPKHWTHWRRVADAHARQLAAKHARAEDEARALLTILGAAQEWDVALYLTDRALAGDWPAVAAPPHTQRRARACADNGVPNRARRVL